MIEMNQFKKRLKLLFDEAYSSNCGHLTSAKAKQCRKDIYACLLNGTCDTFKHGPGSTFGVFVWSVLIFLS
jgi:hypothetical protein